MARLSRRLSPSSLVRGLVALCCTLSQAQAPAPAHHWLFAPARIDRHTVHALCGPDAELLGEAEVVAGPPEALVLDGVTASVSITTESSRAGLPTRDLSVEAWVMVEKPLTWGGILGAVRDNGTDETGWVLGYREDQFSFALATDDQPRLTYLAAETPFRPFEWYHVVGTYDGATHCLYVNGSLAASDGSRHGDLLYPPTDTFYEIGAYHDTNEYYRLTGMIHEVAVYDRALTAEQVAARHAAKRGRFPARQRRPEPFRVALGPYARFDSPTSATVHWETQDESPSILEYGLADRLDQRSEDSRPKRQHRLTITGLGHRKQYSYRVVVHRPGHAVLGRTHSLDTTFNYAPQPLPTGSGPFADGTDSARFAQAAERIIRATNVTKGYCLVYASGSGQLAYELAKRTELTVVGIDDDADRVVEARRRLQRAKAYGARLTIRHVQSLAELPFTRHFADLVVSERLMTEGTCPGTAAELPRVLRPGGIAYLGQLAGATRPLAEDRLADWLEQAGLSFVMERGTAGTWAKVTRWPLQNTGEWTHQYGRPDNSSYGGESLGGVTATGDLQVQWVGRPGADFGLDRNPRMPAPLAVNGRLFHQGMNRMIALGAYNGAVLWTLEIPDLRRVNMPRDASNWCADADRLYVAIRDRCWVLDAATGERVLTCAMPEPATAATHEWSYVAQAGDLLYGSTAKRGSSFTEFWGRDAWYDKAGPTSAKVCSDGLFARRKQTGELAWQYAGGVLLNTTLTIGHGRVYFVESQNPEVAALDTGRIGSEKLWLDQQLVALDAITGTALWEQPLDTVEGTVVFYLAYADERLLLVSSAGGKYHLYAFDATDGKPAWQAEHNWPANNHSGHMQHPVLVGGAVYLEPCGYDLATGKLLTTRVSRREGCATYAATDGALIHRGQSRRITLWDRKTEAASSWFNLRPSCWLSTIPANGMVLSPEGGGGCSCGNWLETSLGFAPRIAEGGER